MKHLHVACAIIEHDGLVLAAQRSASMSLPLKWEFPGGKIKPGENPEECLRRELVEELNVKVSVKGVLSSATHDYPALKVTLYPFVCSIEAGKLHANEHAALVWLSPDELSSLDWAEADLPLIVDYCRQRNSVQP